MILTTYDSLKRYVNAFAKNDISLLVIRSRGGLGKTYLVKQAIKDSECTLFNGHATPLSIYLRLMKYPENNVVFDDVDSLITNKISIALLKQICEIQDNKTIRYNTTFQPSKGEQIPQSFKSNNKVCLLCNDFKRIGKNIKALLTRGIFIDFRPSDKEILDIMWEGFENLDRDIFIYLQSKSEKIKDLNFRTYVKCVELKKARLSWKKYLIREFSINIQEELALQLADLPTEERNRRWITETGTSVRKLQRILKRHKHGV